MQDSISFASYVTSEMAASDPKIKARIRSISPPFRESTVPPSCSDRNGKGQPQKLDTEKRLHFGPLCLGLGMLAMYVMVLRSFVSGTSDNI